MISKIYYRVSNDYCLGSDNSAAFTSNSLKTFTKKKWKIKSSLLKQLNCLGSSLTIIAVAIGSEKSHRERL